MFDYLPQKFLKKLKDINANEITEIRLRVDKNFCVYIGNNQIKYNEKVTKEDITEVIMKVCKGSLYSYDEQIKNGFITTDNGERIGLSGEFVVNNGEITAIKNYSSLNIRIAKQVIGFANEYFNKVYKKGSILVVSKTGVGKTTFIRDFARLVSTNLNKNTVIIDERNEICGKTEKSCFDIGENTDILTYSTKSYGFVQGVRTLNPEYIVTDELITKNDFLAVKNAVLTGVNVVATLHAGSVSDLKNNGNLNELIKIKAFEQILLIENENNCKKISVYNSGLEKICSL